LFNELLSLPADGVVRQELDLRGIEPANVSLWLVRRGKSTASGREVLIRLVDRDTGVEMFTATTPVSRLPDITNPIRRPYIPYSWAILQPMRIKPGSAVLEIALNPPIERGPEVLVRYHSDDVYQAGVLSVNGRAAPGDLAFRFGCSRFSLTNGRELIGRILAERPWPWNRAILYLGLSLSYLGLIAALIVVLGCSLASTANWN